MRKPHSAEPKSSTSTAGDQEQDLQLLKAVAQAWHAQAGNSKPTNEFDAQRAHSSFRPGPTRFKIEAINNMMNTTSTSTTTTTTWDFAESLLDSYEIVTLSKRLEASLAVDPTAAAMHEKTPGRARAGRRARGERSRNSLKSLFHKASSKS